MDAVVMRIVNRMKDQGLDQKTLAKKIGIRQQAVSEWKNGVTASYTKYLPQLADVLNTSVEYLMTGNEVAAATQNEDVGPYKREVLERVNTMTEGELALLMERIDKIMSMRE